MSAEEVLRIIAEICNKYSDRGCNCEEECPFCRHICKDWMAEHMDVVYAICEQWKADHGKKEPEVEWVNVCRIIEIQVIISRNVCMKRILLDCPRWLIIRL